MAYSNGTTLQSIVDSVMRTARAGGIIADDERWHPKHIQWLIHNYRHEFIYHNAYLQSPLVPVIDPQTVQDLGCVPLETVDKSECPDLPWGCTVKKVTNVPKFIDLPDMAAATFVGAIDKLNQYNYVPRELIKYRRTLRFSNIQPMWYMIGQNLYVITDDTNLCWINIAGIFEDPTTVCSFTNEGDTCCFDIIKDAYPAPKRMIEDIQQSIIQNEIATFLQTPHDEQNNAAGI